MCIKILTKYCRTAKDLGHFSCKVPTEKLYSKHVKYQPTSLLCHIMWGIPELYTSIVIQSLLDSPDSPYKLMGQYFMLGLDIFPKPLGNYFLHEWIYIIKPLWYKSSQTSESHGRIVLFKDKVGTNFHVFPCIFHLIGPDPSNSNGKCAARLELVDWFFTECKSPHWVWFNNPSKSRKWALNCKCPNFCSFPYIA